ncbi:hypothetical protein [Kitasatospora cheerisanensis]|uniref:Secreted protein n=1 Tax=Kitasatospora cheerisanensis KCTC 2395 TaxID=1348663 RepID=A0A066YHV1_9ACTN|nr:hypothetical protein [Kitasatospora cheerisanensis]KDN81078.1 hypothetical protein KCH_71720 [Kitasatospora cheerisanensis KCTC 2395]
MRTALTTLAAALLAALPTAAAAAETATDTPAPIPNQGYSIPVGAITDLGALPMLGTLGNDFARLLGQ